MGKIRAICVSERRGTKKHEVLQAELKAVSYTHLTLPTN